MSKNFGQILSQAKKIQEKLQKGLYKGNEIKDMAVK